MTMAGAAFELMLSSVTGFWNGLEREEVAFYLRWYLP